MADFYHPLIDAPVPYALNFKGVSLRPDGLLVGGTLIDGAEIDTVVRLDEVRAGIEPSTANPHGGNIYHLTQPGSDEDVAAADDLRPGEYSLEIMVPMFEIIPVAHREMGNYITEDNRRFHGRVMSATPDIMGISRLPTGRQLLWRHLAESIPVQQHESEMLRRLQFEIGPDGGEESSSMVSSDGDDDDDDESINSESSATSSSISFVDDGDVKCEDSGNDVKIKVELTEDDMEIKTEDKSDNAPIKIELTDDDDVESKAERIPVKIEPPSRTASAEPEQAESNALDLRVTSWVDTVASRYRSTSSLKRARDDDDEPAPRTKRARL